MKKEDYSKRFSWDNISIAKYYEIKDILDEEGEDDITKNVRLVALILDKDESEVWDMDLAQVGQYIDKLRFLNKFDIPDHPRMNIRLPGYELEVMKDVTKINVAQYVDYQSFAKMPLREGIDKILSVFLIPKGCTYNTGYDILDLQKTIRENLSFRIGEGLLGFILGEYGRSLTHSLRYCRRQMRKTKDREMMKEWNQKEEMIKEKIQDLIHLVGCVS